MRSSLAIHGWSETAGAMRSRSTVAIAWIFVQVKRAGSIVTEVFDVPAERSCEPSFRRLGDTDAEGGPDQPIVAAVEEAGESAVRGERCFDTRPDECPGEAASVDGEAGMLGVMCERLIGIVQGEESLGECPVEGRVADRCEFPVREGDDLFVVPDFLPEAVVAFEERESCGAGRDVFFQPVGRFRQHRERIGAGQRGEVPPMADFVEERRLSAGRHEQDVAESVGCPVECMQLGQAFGHFEAHGASVHVADGSGFGESGHGRAAVDEAAHHVGATFGELLTFGVPEGLGDGDRGGPQSAVDVVFDAHRGRHEWAAGMVDAHHEPSLVDGVDDPGFAGVAGETSVERSNRHRFAEAGGQVRLELRDVHAISPMSVERGIGGLAMTVRCPSPAMPFTVRWTSVSRCQGRITLPSGIVTSVGFVSR